MSVETSEPRGSLAPSLPIWRTAFGTYALIFRNLGFLIRAGSFWLLLAAVAMTALDWASHRLGWQDRKRSELEATCRQFGDIAGPDRMSGGPSPCSGIGTCWHIRRRSAGTALSAGEWCAAYRD